jgi:hypothetical protein
LSIESAVGPGWLSEFHELERRNRHSHQRLRDLEVAGKLVWPNLAKYDIDGRKPIRERTFIYVTGSVARLEACENSDLDLFVVDSISEKSSTEDDSLNYVEESALIAQLDSVRDAAEFRPFSRGGEFVRVHSLSSMVDDIGDRNDDYSNSFTARLLLLMNSRPLLNRDAYEAARKRVLSAYWDESDPDVPFLPIMLTNDIRRWWGVLCLNFEKYNRRTEETGFDSTPERRIENLKLRYSKMLAVYSVLLGFISVATVDGLSRNAADGILESTPLERLRFVMLQNEFDDEICKFTKLILKEYDEYLSAVSVPKCELIDKLSDVSIAKGLKERSYLFHDYFVHLFSLVGAGRSPLYEYCII